MKEILWTILNYGMLIVIIRLFIRAVKLVKKEFGKRSAIILAIGIGFLILGNISNKQATKVSLERMNDYVIDDIQLSPINSLSVAILADTIGHRYKYRTHFSSKLDFLIQPISWRQEEGGVSRTQQGYLYYIDGTKEWNLLSVNIFKQRMVFNREVKSE
jgi:hypothetical protein